jgi:hypothetical protein
MPSVQQILDYADRKYPNQETDANKIIDLDDLHKKIYVQIARLKNDYEIYETTTVADQLTYALPSNCTIDNIITVEVSQSTTITASTEWNTHDYAGLKDDIDNGYFYGRATSSTIALTADGLPINTAGLSIRIFYYKTPNALSVVTDTPELDSDYHDLLKYGLIQSLASQGHNPDTEIADYWQNKYDEFLQEVKDSLSDRENSAPNQSNQVEEHW